MTSIKVRVFSWSARLEGILDKEPSKELVNQSKVSVNQHSLIHTVAVGNIPSIDIPSCTVVLHFEGRELVFSHSLKRTTGLTGL